MTRKSLLISFMLVLSAMPLFGTRFVLETPGGGGYGDPRARAPQAVLDDVLDGYVTPEAAERPIL